MHPLRIAGLFALALLSAPVSPPEVCACASASRSGEHVRIAGESAIILWDAASGIQHFIRRASFETEAKDFGFLVPTPSVPELAETSDEAFKYVEKLVASTIYTPKADAAKSPAPAVPKVVVVATAKVAGYDAAVLDASDAGALDAWLKANGYASSPDLVAWYAPYIDRRWKITAFKIDRQAPEKRGLDAPAVRMSFKTDRPFFPYREPASAQAGSPGKRDLTLYYIGENRPEGRLGDSGAWPGTPLLSLALEPNQRAELATLLRIPAAQAGPMSRMTVFVDSSSPRPGKDDLYFSPAGDQSEMNVIAGSNSSESTFYLVLAAAATIFLLWLFWPKRKRPKP